MYSVKKCCLEKRGGGGDEVIYPRRRDLSADYYIVRKDDVDIIWSLRKSCDTLMSVLVG